MFNYCDLFLNVDEGSSKGNSSKLNLKILHSTKTGEKVKQSKIINNYSIKIKWNVVKKFYVKKKIIEIKILIICSDGVKKKMLSMNKILKHLSRQVAKCVMSIKK